MNQRGFTLIEMALVLAIIGLVVGGGLIAVGPMIDQTHVTTTKNNMDQVESALVLFVIRNNRLPCPADGSQPNSGVEAVTASGAGSPQVCTVALTHSVIPWVTLGMDPQYSVDGWNNRIAYFPAGGQNPTVTEWDSLVDPGITATTSAIGTATLSAPTLTLTVTAGAGYSGAPSFLINGGGTNVVPPLAAIAESGGAIAFTGGETNVGSGYTTTPTVVIGTAGCLYRNGGATNGRYSLCDGSLSGGTKTYLTPSYPYGNYIAVYSIVAGACGNEVTSPNHTVVGTPGTCSAAPTAGAGDNPAGTPLQNIQSWGNRAAYVIVSHGKSGYYGWSKSGTQVPAPTGVSQLKTYNSNGSAGANLNLGFVQGAPFGLVTGSNSAFDDIVRWRSPAMIIQLCGAGACGNP